MDIDLITPVKSGNVQLLKSVWESWRSCLSRPDGFLYLYAVHGQQPLSTVLKELGDAGICADLVFENPVEEYKKLIGCETIGKAIGVLGKT